MSSPPARESTSTSAARHAGLADAGSPGRGSENAGAVFLLPRFGTGRGDRQVLDVKQDAQENVFGFLWQRLEDVLQGLAPASHV